MPGGGALQGQSRMSEKNQRIKCSEEQIENLKKIASSTTAGIWRIKRAKIILGALEGRSVSRLVLEVRVPPDTIKKFLERFAKEKMKVFEKPNRRPTSREASVERMLALLEEPPPARSRKWKDVTVRYIGQDFSARAIKEIRDLIAANPEYPRAEIARQLCLIFGLYQSNGKLKITAASIILKRMDMDNVIFLPLATRIWSTKPVRTSLAVPEPRETMVFDSGDLEQLQFIPARTKRGSSLWNSLVERYHYIPSYRLWGAQMKYLVYGGKHPAIPGKTTVENGNKTFERKSRRNQAITWNTEDLDGHRGEHLLAVLGFGAASWRLRSRDEYIGWSDELRSKNLKLVVNNVRFLVLPWVRSPNLASRILGGITRQLSTDWQERYNYRPVLLETFVQLGNFRGTCYRAANWIQVGTTQGYGLDKKHKENTPVKAIFLYPLHRNFRRILCKAQPLLQETK